jgi:RNA recognition motif-containing protein
MAQKLFVGSLSFSTTSEGLREFFAQAGNVTSATVITDQFSGRSRGFGFVEMSTPEEAQAAVQRLNGKDLDGRQIKVEIAKPAGSGGGGGGPRRGPGGGGGRGGFGGGGGRPGGGGPGGGRGGNRW